MAEPLSPIPLTPGASANISLPEPNTIQALVISNKSPLDLQISGTSSYGTRWLAAGIEDIFYNDGGNQGVLGIASFNTANLPITQLSVVLVTVYRSNEKVPQGSWPTSIPTQTVNTNAVSSTTEKIVNLTNPPGTNFINVQPTDAATPTYIADTDGDFQVLSDNAGVLTNLLHLVAGASPEVLIAAAGLLTNILGTLQVDGLLTALVGVRAANGSFFGVDTNNTWAAVTGTGGGMNTRIQSAGSINFQVPGGTTRFHVSTFGLEFDNGSLKWNSGDTLSNTHKFTGVGTGTYSHGAGATPYIVLPVTNIAGSQTVGYDSANSTQVHITAAAGLSFAALCMVG